LAEANQVKVIRQIVRTWSNTHREGGPLLKAPAARKTAAPAAPQGIRIVSASLATCSVQRLEEDRNELRPPCTEDASDTSDRRIEAREEAKTAIFRHEGEYWQILHKGQIIHIRSLKGLFYLRHLLQHPGEKIHVSSLAALGDHYSRPGRSTADRGLDVPPDPPLLAHDLGGVIDSRAAREYRTKLDELRSELEEASQWADLGRAASIQREIEFIEKELASAYGLNGQLRKLDDQIERMRKAVTNCIRDSIVRIAKQNPALGRHLSNAIRTGLLCRYSPENTVCWDF
jgi:hypothetical protein